jgi:hypothetical protein
VKTQTANREQTAQEYLTVGAVFLAGGVMFIAGSQQLTGSALQGARMMTVIMIGLGAVLLGVSVGMRRRPALKAPARTKAAAKKRSNGSKK